jgi:hypothetical protein
MSLASPATTTREEDPLARPTYQEKEDPPPVSAAQQLQQAIQQGLISRNMAETYLMGGSNDPVNFIDSPLIGNFSNAMNTHRPGNDVSGYAMQQMINQAGGINGFSHKVTLPDGSEARDLPPVELTQGQLDAVKMAGMLEQENIASHFMRVDDPGGFSDAAKALMHTHSRAGDPTVFTINRKVVKHAGPKPQPVTWDQSVEALNIVQTVKAALGIKGPVSEEELARSMQAIQHATVNQASGALQSAIISARNGPLQKSSQVHRAIKNYVGASIRKAVQEATPHVPKNDVDATFLRNINARAEDIAKRRAGWSSGNPRPLTEKELADIQLEAWNEWVNQRAYELAKAQAAAARAANDNPRIAPFRVQKGGKHPDNLPVTLSNGDILNSTYSVVVSNDAPSHTVQAVIEEVAEGDTGFDITKSLQAAFEGAPP